MRIASKKDGLDWMETMGFRVSSDRPDFVVIKQERIPPDANHRIYMVKDDLSDYRGHDGLIYFANWSVWPSGEWFPLFERLQSAYKLEGKLIDKRAYFFSAEEYDDMLNFVIIGVIFLWDLYVMSENGRVVFYSHDEMRDIGRKESSGCINVT
ncbi:MAG TPA: hypothetical protein VIS48_00850 [Candidatus Kryptonia bacterium]